MINNKYFRYLLTTLVGIVLLSVALYFCLFGFGAYYDHRYPRITGEDDLGAPIFVLSYTLATGVILLPLIILISNYIIKKLFIKQGDGNVK